MVRQLRECITRFLHDEDGATMVEYAIMLGLICGVCLAVVAILGGEASGLFTANGNALISAL